MRKTHLKPATLFTKVLSSTGLLVLCVYACLQSAQAESLFRSGISYQTTQNYTPRSFFAVPRPATVGDMVTININETNAITLQNNATVGKKQTITENGSNILSRLIGRVTGVKDVVPSVNGLNNETQVGVTATNQKVYNFRDAITCQVVQVLPNGNLLVQGKKTVFANQEEQDLFVSGIVNPFFLNSQNSIESTRVANLQMNLVGKGMFSRQQSDGILGKYYGIIN